MKRYVIGARARQGWKQHARHTSARRAKAAFIAVLSIAAASAITQTTYAAEAAPTLHIVYLALTTLRPPPSAVLTAPPRDDSLQGARLAVHDNATTGQFLNQDFVLDETVSADAAALQAAFARALTAGGRVFITDVPQPLLLKLADSAGAQAGAQAAVLLDATSRDDSLRGSDCRSNVLHLLPSRAMLADALMQYLSAKNWRRILLLSGTGANDRLYAEAVRRAAAKFEIKLADDRSWTFNPAAQQADTGHYQVNDEVNTATQGARYDVLVVADEAGNFGDQLAFRTALPRPVAGTQGLVPTAWSPIMDEYASTQLQLRFRRQTGRGMTERDYGGWLAARVVGEAATRTNSLDPDKLIAFLKSPGFTVSGYKGPPLSFRLWDGQLRQPILLADAASLVSISPQPGFLHQTNTLDTLGADQPETACHR